MNKTEGEAISPASSSSSSSAAYGKVRMRYVSSFLAAKGTRVLECKPGSPWERPPTFGDLWQDTGFVLYETTIPEMFRQPDKLETGGLHDRGYVFLDGVMQVGVSRFRWKERRKIFKH